MMQTFEGGCLCGTIRYRISGIPLSSTICHCATCRAASAAPTVAWLSIERAQFQVLSGYPQLYQSSPDVIRRFCGNCGCQLLYENAASPNTIDVTTVTLDLPNAFPPTLEVWLEHKIPWQEPSRTLAHRRQDLEEADEPRAIEAR
jgi:hypothetical protein